jgi:protein Tex
VDETFGLPTVTDILLELDKPGRDPRPAFKTATFNDAVHTLNDLKVGMVLEGVVTNVAAFGAFIDIGVHCDGLAHVSRLSRNFVKDPREVVKSGDIVRAKVLEVDTARKRISLTLRLDEDTNAERGPQQREPRGGGQQARGGQRGGGQQRTQGGQQRRGQRQESGGGGAMADALRKAGYKPK